MGRAASHRLLSRHSRLVAGVGIVGCSSPQACDRGCGGAVGFEGAFLSIEWFCADLLLLPMQEERFDNLRKQRV